MVAAARGYELVSRHPRYCVEQLRRLAEDKAFPIDAAVPRPRLLPPVFRRGIRAEALALGLAA